MSHQHFDALSMPLDGLRLIEASAGTGKTFSLAGLYLRLLIERRLEPRQILVMTFTRAATQELRERIRLRLNRAAQLAGAPDQADRTNAEDAFALALIEIADESRGDLARRLGAAARAMDQAAITTIHGFSQQATADHAFASALPFERGDTVDDRALLTETVTDYWRARALGPQASPGFLALWPQPADLLDDLQPLQERPHAVIAAPANDELGQQVQHLRETWPEQRDALADALHHCRDGKAFNKKISTALAGAGGIDPALDAIESALRDDAAMPLLPEWVALLVDAAAFHKKKAALSQAVTEHPLSQRLAALQAIARPTLLRDAAREVQALSVSRKRQRRQISFNDMISALQQAVQDPKHGAALADGLHQTWPWALIDEFQDTDPLQYQILQRIYRDREHGGLFLIGDPKQAIYRFRGGDVHAYLNAVRDAGDRSYSLATNYRSSQALLDAVETLFRHPGDDAFLVKGIAFQTVSAGRDDQAELHCEGRAQPAMTFWPLEPDDTRKTAAERICRQACVAQIQQWLQTPAEIVRHKDGKPERRPVVAADIAVLVNSNAQASAMQRALSWAGIPAVCLHQDSIFATHEALELQHLLRAAASPAEEDLVRAALSGEIFGLRLGDLLALQQDEAAWLQHCDMLQNAHQRWRDHGVLAMLQPLVQQAAPRLLQTPDGERRLSNYLQLAELLAEAEPQCFDMHGLVHWLHRSRLDCDSQAEEQQLRLETDQALVRITTVHKAKGLEYPLVVLPFAPWLGAGGDPNQPPWQYHDDQGRDLIDWIGADDAQAAAVREQRAEALRLLYVAMTRAAVACCLPWGAVNGAQNSALASLLHRELIPAESWLTKPRNNKPLDHASVRGALDELDGCRAIGIRPLPEFTDRRSTGSLDDGDDVGARSDFPAPPERWSVHSFSGLVRASAAAHARGRAEDESIPGGAAITSESAPEPAECLPETPRGPRFGEAVHALLEHGQPDDWPASGPLTEACLEETARRLRGQGLATEPAAVQGTAELVRQTWHTPLPHVGALAALSARQRRAEMEFHFTVADGDTAALLDLLDSAGYGHGLAAGPHRRPLRGLMHGFIDLCVEVGGRYYVLDYKTNDLGPTDWHYREEALQTAINEHHYDLQYLIYLTALHRLLRQRLPDYDPEQHLGGALYLFLRGLSPQHPGRGVHVHRPTTELILALDGCFAGEGLTA